MMSYLHSESERMMYGAEEIGDLFGGPQIGGVGKSYRVGVDTWPPCSRLLIIFCSFGGMTCYDGGYERAVQTSGQ